MSDSETIPVGLGLVGAGFWRDVSAVYSLTVDSLLLLEQAARTLDTIALLDAELVGQPMTVKGSMGQIREHPLLSEVRQQRASLARLLNQLALPDDIPDSGRARGSAGRALARQRWTA